MFGLTCRGQYQIAGVEEIAFQGADLWIIDTLRRRPHPSHPHLAQALEWIERLKPGRALLTHLDNSMDYETLRAELPDMLEEEIDLTLEDNTLTLRGERKLDTEVAEEQFHRIERSYGPFARTFALPPTVDAGKVSAEYKAGVLTVRLPLREDAKPRQIKVQVAA